MEMVQHPTASGADEAPQFAAASPDLAVNVEIAAHFREAAALLDAQNASQWRAAAYRKAAATLGQLDTSVRDIFDRGGVAALDALPGIGRGIRAAIAEFLITGRWSQLDRLRGTVDPEALFQQVPGIGPELAARLHDTLGIDSLEALEAAAYDGRIARLPGVGPRRLAALRANLDRLLKRVRPRPQGTAVPAPANLPTVEVILQIDERYRSRAFAGDLPRIAPRRFNPRGEAWLPVLHERHAGWHFTALFSNTARAHELGRTRDWVVVYFYDHDHVETQCTVVTETHGSLAGKRVVRGREAECRAYYSGSPTRG